MRARFVTIIAVGAAVLMATTFGISAWALAGQSNLALTNCHQIELLKTVIRSTISQSVATLGVKGAAGYEYYHSHPAELAAAKANAKAELANFKPRSC